MSAGYSDIDGEDPVADNGYGDWPEPPTYRGLKFMLAALVLAAIGTGIFLGWDYLVPVDHRARAMKFLAQEDYAAAVIELKQVLRDNPDDGELRWIMGNAYQKMHQNAYAADYLKTAFELGYRNPDFILSLARSKLLVRKYTDALKLYDDWSDVDSDAGAAAWEIVRGQSLLKLGRQSEAVTSFLQALRLDPDNREAKMALAESGLGADLPGLSTEEINRALSTGLDEPETWILRGEWELSRGNMKAARIAFEGATELEADNVHAITGLVRVLIASNLLEDARKPAALLAKKFPTDPMGAYVRALYAMQSEEYVQALDALKVVLDHEPDHAMSILLKGEVYFAMGNMDLALEYLDLFHRMVPDNMLGRRRLAAALIESGSPKQAVALLEPLLDQIHRHPEIATLLSSAYAKLGDKKKSRAYQSVSFKVGSETSATRVALEHLNSGELQEAIAQLEQLSAHTPEKRETRIMLAISLLRSAEYDKARDISSTLLAESPGNPEVQYLHGSVLELSGDPHNAAQFYERALALDARFHRADLSLARLEMGNGERDAARQRIEALLVNDPGNTTAKLWLAQMAVQDGNTVNAITRLEEARTADKSALQPRLILADLYLQQGKADSAEAIGREIAKMVPNHTVGLSLLANAQLRAGNIDDGLAILLQLEELNPENLELKWQIVDAQEAKGDPAATYDALQRILAVDENSARALVKLAMLERLRGDEEAALALADHLTRSHPGSGMGYLIKGQILMDSEDYRGAANILETAFTLNGDSVTLSKYYTALARAGEKERAERAMSDWLEANPDDSIARLAWADDAFHEGDSARAVEQYEQVAHREPDNVAVLVRLASAYHEIEDRRDLKTAQQAYELDSEDIYAKHLYAWLLVETGLSDRGAQLLQEVVDRAPQNATFRFHLAVALADSGLEDDARVVLQSLTGPNVQFAEKSKARALMEQLGTGQ